MDTYRNGLILATLVLICIEASAQSFMECADIEDDSNRLSCYDNAAAFWEDLKTQLQTALTETQGSGTVMRSYWSAHQRFFKQVGPCHLAPSTVLLGAY